MDEEKFKATSIREIKDELRKYGYEINRLDEWDKESKDVVYAFQLHFNPKNATGEMDLETFAILKALNKNILIKKVIFMTEKEIELSMDKALKSFLLKLKIKFVLAVIKFLKGNSLWI